MLFGVSALGIFGTVRSELTPSEDSSLAFLRVSAPQGVSLDYFARQMRELEALVQPLKDSGEIETTFSIAGSGNSQNNGFMVMGLAPWEKRERSQQQIMQDVNRLVSQVPGVTETGPYNSHFVTDIALAFAASSAGLALAGLRPGRRY